MLASVAPLGWTELGRTGLGRAAQHHLTLFTLPIRITCSDLNIELYCRVRGTSYKHGYTGATKRYVIKKRLSKSDDVAESYLYQQA